MGNGKTSARSGLSKAPLIAVKWRARVERALYLTIVNTPGALSLLGLCHRCHVELATPKWIGVNFKR